MVMSSPFLSVKERAFHYIERLFRGKCKILGESGNSGSGLERKGGEERGKD